MIRLGERASQWRDVILFYAKFFTYVSTRTRYDNVRLRRDDDAIAFTTRKLPPRGLTAYSSGSEQITMIWYSYRAFVPAYDQAITAVRRYDTSTENLNRV